MGCVQDDGRMVDLDKVDDRIEWRKVSRRPESPWRDKREDDGDDDDDEDDDNDDVDDDDNDDDDDDEMDSKVSSLWQRTYTLLCVDNYFEISICISTLVVPYAVHFTFISRCARRSCSY